MQAAKEKGSQASQGRDVTRGDEVLAVSLELASKSWKVGLDDGKRNSPAVHGVDHDELGRVKRLLGGVVHWAASGYNRGK